MWPWSFWKRKTEPFSCVGVQKILQKATYLWTVFILGVWECDKGYFKDFCAICIYCLWWQKLKKKKKKNIPPQGWLKERHRVVWGLCVRFRRVCLWSAHQRGRPCEWTCSRAVNTQTLSRDMCPSEHNMPYSDDVRHQNTSQFLQSSKNLNTLKAHEQNLWLRRICLVRQRTHSRHRFL